jgi:hypothetical protein
MRKHFKDQLERNRKVTQEKLDEVTQKTYTSGRDIKPGETILFALLKEGEKVEMVALHEEEINSYKFEGEYKEIIPFISKV